MDCFIQRTQTPKYLFCCVVDTINEGVPCSSSLRTPQPLGPQSSSSSAGAIVAAHATAQHTKSYAANAVEPIALPRHLFARLEQLGNNVAQYLSRTPDEPFRSFFRDQKAGCKKIVLRALRDGNYAWAIETTCRYCAIRKQKCGSAEHKDGGRKATFVVWATGLTKQGTYDESKVGCVKQMCIANSCTGGVGPASPAWSGWLGNGVSAELRKSINDVLRPHLQQLGIPILGASLPARSLFDYDPEYDNAAIAVAEQAENLAENLKREREEIEIADRIVAQHMRQKQNRAE